MSEKRIILFVDLNDDGDGADAGEEFVCYDDDDVSGIENDPVTVYDIELIDYLGKKFIMAYTADHYGYSQVIIVFGLNSNGIHDGNGVKLLSDVTGEDYQMAGMEFDAVPEPPAGLVLSVH